MLQANFALSRRSSQEGVGRSNVEDHERHKSDLNKPANSIVGRWRVSRYRSARLAGTIAFPSSASLAHNGCDPSSSPNSGIAVFLPLNSFAPGTKVGKHLATTQDPIYL